MLQQIDQIPLYVGTSVCNRNVGGSNIDMERASVLQKHFERHFETFNYSNDFSPVAKDDYSKDALEYALSTIDGEAGEDPLYNLEVVKTSDGGLESVVVTLEKGSLSLFGDSSSKERLEFLQGLSMKLFSNGFYNRRLLRDYLTTLSKVV